MGRKSGVVARFSERRGPLIGRRRRPRGFPGRPTATSCEPFFPTPSPFTLHAFTLHPRLPAERGLGLGPRKREERKVFGGAPGRGIPIPFPPGHDVVSLLFYYSTGMLLRIAEVALFPPRARRAGEVLGLTEVCPNSPPPVCVTGLCTSWSATPCLQWEVLYH